MWDENKTSKLKICLLFFLVFGQNLTAVSQNEKTDTTIKSSALAEVVVTATRTERQLSAIPIPTTLISKKQITQMGSLRLGDVLQEQTGLAIVTDHGQGIQVQGFAPDYTLILIDGEPLIGRTAGTLELSRIAVGNIKQIEIVKGPSSSLYGSEALAGVINIITERPSGFKSSFRTRYGSNATVDISSDLSIRKDKTGIYAFFNYYGSNGYDLDKSNFGATVDPFKTYTGNIKITHDFTHRTRMSVAGRYFTENQTGPSLIGTEIINTKGKVGDWNINPILTHEFSDKIKTQIRLYHSTYRTESESKFKLNDSLFDQTFFDQTFNRAETVTDWTINENNHFTGGGGYLLETVESTRYDDRKALQTIYTFLNHEFTFRDKFGVIAGIRYDYQNVYGSQLSPKISAKYNLSKRIILRGSVGMGFKAPDFRQLYLNFTNAAAGYSVFGTEEVQENVKNLQQQGQIADIFIDPASLGNIQAESSTAYNLGSIFQWGKGLRGSVNFFLNDITNLIETQAVARKTNGQSVFSYRNLAKVKTFGMETDWNIYLGAGFNLGLGYQFLETRDMEVWKNIKDGKVYGRDPITLETTLVTLRDYGGLFNRSQHSGNIKLFYENNKLGLNGSLRMIYRGRYGVTDLNGNQIIDTPDEYVDGFSQWNIAAAKNFRNGISVQAGIDNLFDFRNVLFMPGIAGRLYFVTLSFTFEKKKKQ
jgi:outer membrane receptor for ferrienterochelin and colicins